MRSSLGLRSSLLLLGIKYEGWLQLLLSRHGCCCCWKPHLTTCWTLRLGLSIDCGEIGETESNYRDQSNRPTFSINRFRLQFSLPIVKVQKIYSRQNKGRCKSGSYLWPFIAVAVRSRTRAGDMLRDMLGDMLSQEWEGEDCCPPDCK